MEHQRTPARLQAELGRTWESSPSFTLRLHPISILLRPFGGPSRCVWALYDPEQPRLMSCGDRSARFGRIWTSTQLMSRYCQCRLVVQMLSSKRGMEQGGSYICCYLFNMQ